MSAIDPRRRPVGPVICGLLGLAQGTLAILRAAHWVDIGSDISRQGLILLPIVGAMMFARATIVGIIAVLWGLFAWGALLRHRWAWATGLAASAANALVVALALVAGGLPGQVLPWAVVPVVLAGYLLAPAGRRALRAGR